MTDDFDLFTPAYDPQEVSLVIMDVAPGASRRNLIVRFCGGTNEICAAYNMAIEQVLREAGADPYHQFGATAKGSNEPGSHGWEAWPGTSVIDKGELERLLPVIREKALKNLP